MEKKRNIAQKHFSANCWKVFLRDISSNEICRRLHHDKIAERFSYWRLIPSRTSNLCKAKATRSEDGRKSKSSGSGKTAPSNRISPFVSFPCSSISHLYLCKPREEAASRREEWFIRQWATVQAGRKVQDGNRISADRYGAYTCSRKSRASLRFCGLHFFFLVLSLFLSLLFHAKSGFRVVIRMTGFHRWRWCISTVDT